ncbi:hypothetical protein MFLAVUS_000453 [Mucor flavus]|uniref:Uncharacterized protein n=1 Tax=Mucor flavus TaxID=439312 RepID=A0ABP9YJR5_9FUNG
MSTFSPPQEKPSIDTFYRRKSSVTFDLPPTPNEELLSSCAVSSPTIDITAQVVPDTMLVALFDRSSEMKGLVRHNKTYFQSLQHHLDDKWSRFETVVYCERSKMSDKEWMKRISYALQGLPSQLEKFKELVGYLGEETEQESQDYFSNVNIGLIRDYPERLSTESYPQFFINCENCLCTEKEYNQFISNLFSKELTNSEWETRVFNVLNQYPNLLEQLQEIVAYETELE